MLRETVQPSSTSLLPGEVIIRPRRGQDYTVLRSEGGPRPDHPDALAMRRTVQAAVGPTHRLG